jgi:hypothetical protein
VTFGYLKVAKNVWPVLPPSDIIWQLIYLNCLHFSMHFVSSYRQLSMATSRLMYTGKVFCETNHIRNNGCLYCTCPDCLGQCNTARNDPMDQHSLKTVNNCLNYKKYSYLEKSGGQNSNLYLNVVHFFNTSVN